MSAPLRILLIAGEASGDMHAAAFVRELRQRRPNLEVVGVGGAQLRAAGMRTVVDSEHVATMGFVETLGTIGRHIRLYRALVAMLERDPPDLLVLVDYPEFNLLLARRAKSLGVRVFYFIGPQVWAWRPRRIEKIRARVDKMAVVFSFEAELYNVGGERFAEFVGHPLLDIVHTTRERLATRELYGLAPDRPVLALLPGSRNKEVSQIGPPMLAAAAALQGEGWQPIVAVAPGLGEEAWKPLLQRSPGIAVAHGDTYNVLGCADAAVVASGTATVETALLGCPMVIVYRMAPLSFQIARRLVHVEWIGMPNIVLRRSVFPELVQDEATGPAIAAAVRSVREREPEMRAALGELRTALGEPGAAGRAADLALGLVG
jgi:lipid-A-disaccharide synthase